MDNIKRVWKRVTSEGAILLEDGQTTCKSVYCRRGSVVKVRRSPLSVLNDVGRCWALEDRCGFKYCTTWGFQDQKWSASVIFGCSFSMSINPSITWLQDH